MAASQASTKKTPPQPSPRQRDILDAYHANPNAAAVGFVLKTNERHVRRLVKGFAPYLEDRRRARDAERLDREWARQARIQDWLDETSAADLTRLGKLTGSHNEGIALRAIKIKLDLSASLSVSPTAPGPSSPDAPLAELERALEHSIEDWSDASPDDDGSHDE